MATQINSFYKQHAMEYAVISPDGMVVTLPSEKHANACYEVRCEHTAKGVEAVSCQCWGFSRWGHCKHLVIVNEWQNAQAPKVVTCEVEAGKWYIVSHDTQVWQDAETGEWLAAGPTENAIAIVEAHLAVKTAEQIVSQPVTQPAIEVVELTESVEQTIAPVRTAVSDSKKLSSVLAEQKVDWGLVGNLNGSSQGFQLMR